MTVRVASAAMSPSPSVAQKPRYYRAQEFEVFNMLQHPVWVFDVEHPRMLWANTQALRVWNAPNLESLLARDFTDVTAATQVRMKELWQQLQLEQVIQEEWTFYPDGRATTLSMTLSAISIDADGRIGCLAEAELPNKDAFLESTVRGIELLRHLPFAVSQFSMEGTLLYRNPEAIRLFGSTETISAKTSSSSSNSSSPSESGDFLRPFVDPEYGRMALHQVQEGLDFHGEAQYQTLQGRKWFAVTLRRTRDPVTSHFVILHSVRDISDIMQARQETTRAKQFLAVMAHEIRTPLHQIIGSVDLLEEDSQNVCGGGGGDRLDSVQQIKSSSSLLMSIINDLLDYSKLEVGQMQMENVTFALDGVIDGCLACVKPEAERKSLVLTSTTNTSTSGVNLVGDPNRLRQIILNLLSNAVKFTDHGSVRLAVSCLERTANVQKLRFAVTDTGIGIDPSEQGAVFEKYRQANASVARHFGGTGLGLAICKGLVELLGGTIGLESQLGQGTTVFFEISFCIPNPTSSSHPTSELSSALSNPLSSPSWHVLIVEDNKVNQKVLQAMLRRLGHVSTTAEHGKMALEVMQRTQFDLILMDVQMPVMDGIACTQHIRTTLGFNKQQVRIIGLTAGFLNSEKEYYENEVGMNCCLGKPIRMEALKNAISQQQLEHLESSQIEK